MLSADYLQEVSWIIELGAGTGLLGISALKYFQNIKAFVATDGSQKALENCQRNFATNLSLANSFKASFERIDWSMDVDKFQGIVSKHSQVGNGFLIGAGKLTKKKCQLFAKCE